MKKCKAIGEVAVMEVPHQQQVGVKTRARTLAIAAASTATSTAGKKRKISTSGELHFSSSFIQLRSRRKLLITSENSISPTNSENSARVNHSNSCSNPSSDDFPASRCSSNGSSMRVNESLISSSVVDLEQGEGFEMENSNSMYLDCKERGETTPSSNLQSESGELESTERMLVTNSSERRSSTKEKMTPSEAEIEEFFSVAEKDEQKRFANRYNFDFVKEVPLEGRFEWVRLTQ